MPELPEVEIYARYFARHALRQRIARVRVLDERILGAVRKEAFARALRGRAFTRVRRHGKHLFADAGGTWLHLHFGMTGDLGYYRDDPPRFPVDRLTAAEIRTIFTTMRKILLTVIERHERGDDYPPRYLIHHREEGARCPRCGGTIVKSVVFGRTTYACTRHQT